MEQLLLLDAKDYDEDMDEFVRAAVRGIVFTGDKLLPIEDNKGELAWDQREYRTLHMIKQHIENGGVA